MTFPPLLGSPASWGSRGQIATLNKDLIEFYMWFSSLITVEETEKKDKNGNNGENM